MFTIDLRVILWITVVTGVYALLLKFLQKNSPHRCSNERGGSKAFWTMLNKMHFSYPEASLITLITFCYTSFMFWLFMNLNLLLKRLIVVTVVTPVIYFLVFAWYVLFQNLFPCSLVATLITIIHKSLVFWLFMKV